MSTLKNLKWRVIIFSFWTLTGLASAPLVHADPWITGYAYDLDSDRLLYKELHYLSADNATVSGRVEYVDNAQEIIVLKTLDFSRSLFAPTMEQKDFRRSTSILTRYSSTGMEVGYQNDENPMQWNSLALSDRLIIDAGFDPYVRSHWEALQAGDVVRAEFLVPARLDTVNISIRASDTYNCEAQAKAILCLVIRPAGFLRLVSWFVDPLYLAYDLESQRILLYKGISNLLDNEGNTQDVVIRYQYH